MRTLNGIHRAIQRDRKKAGLEPRVYELAKGSQPLKRKTVADVTHAAKEGDDGGDDSSTEK